MNKEQISEKEIEKVSGGAWDELAEAMQDDISKHLRKVKCSQCGKMFEIYDGPMGVIPTPAFNDSRSRCSECREKKPFPEFMLQPHERWRIKNKTEKTKE